MELRASKGSVKKTIVDDDDDDDEQEDEDNNRRPDDCGKSARTPQVEGTPADDAVREESSNVDTSWSFELLQAMELAGSRAEVCHGAQRSSNSMLNRLTTTTTTTTTTTMTNNSARLMLLADRKRVYDLLSLKDGGDDDDDELVPSFQSTCGGSRKGGNKERSCRLGTVQSQKEQALASTRVDHKGRSCSEGEGTLTGLDQAMCPKKRAAPNNNTVAESRCKRSKQNRDVMARRPETTRTDAQKSKGTTTAVAAAARRDHTNTASAGTFPPSKGVLIEVSRGEFVQVHGKDKAKRAVAMGRAIVVQCFVCLEQYHVDRSAEALYCTNCETMTRLGKGLRKHRKQQGPLTITSSTTEELRLHDRRIAEQIRNHGFEEPVQRTNRKHEQLLEATMRIT